MVRVEDMQQEILQWYNTNQELACFKDFKGTEDVDDKTFSQLERG